MFSCGRDWGSEAALDIIRGFHMTNTEYVSLVLTHVTTAGIGNLHGIPNTDVTSDIGTQGVDTQRISLKLFGAYADKTMFPC